MRFGLALLLPVVVGGLFSFARLASESFDVPTDADYEALTAYLQNEVGPEDAVVALPAWSLRVHQAARAHRLISGDGLNVARAERFPRLFVVVEPDGEPSLAALGAPRASTTLGRLQVHRFDTGRQVTFDARRSLETSKVRVLGKENIDCDTRRRGGFACGGRKEWQRVSREHMLVSENGDEAIWAHPPARGETLVLAWDEVDLGDRVVVRAGFTREGADRAKASVRVEVRVDGETVGVTERPVDFNFATTVFALTPAQGAKLELRVSSENNGAAHFAVDLFSTQAAP